MPRGRQRTGRFNRRELQIIALIWLSDKEIAAELGLTPKTVKEYFHKIYQREGFYGHNSRVKLGILAFRLGLIDRFDSARAAA